VLYYKMPTETGLMVDSIKVSMSIAKWEGYVRQQAHSHNGTRRFFEDENTEDIIGVTAEIAFGKWSGLEPDLEVRPNGDGCKDFLIKVNGRKISIDIKAARKAFNLLLKQKDGLRSADILVLAKVDGDLVSFLGWEHKSMMLVSPVKDFGYGILNHYRSKDDLRPMRQLLDLIKRRENQ